MSNYVPENNYWLMKQTFEEIKSGSLSVTTCCVLVSISFLLAEINIQLFDSSIMCVITIIGSLMVSLLLKDLAQFLKWN